jgi:hypothetical protein
LQKIKIAYKAADSKSLKLLAWMTLSYGMSSLSAMVHFLAARKRRH